MGGYWGGGNSLPSLTQSGGGGGLPVDVHVNSPGGPMGGGSDGPPGSTLK